MEKVITPYADWPNWVKLATATSTKLLTAKSPKAMMSLVGLSFGAGIGVIFMPYIFSSISGIQYSQYAPLDWLLLFAGFLNILTGLYNWLVTVKAVAWVNENSTWEERFSNRSDSKFKWQYLGVVLGIVLVSYLLAILLRPYVY